MKSACILIAAAGIVAGTLQAQNKPDIEYGKVGETVLRLDACVPPGQGPFPVVILVHGGGWGGGDKKDMRLLNESLTNFTTFSINYRLAPTNRWPACFDDVQTAVRWVKTHASAYKGDPARIALLGYSAGGQLVCLASVLAKSDTRVQAVVGFAAPTDMVSDTERRGGLSKSLQDLLDRPPTTTPEAQKILEDLSAINFVGKGLPPFLLVHGTEDKSVPYDQSVKFQARLNTNSIPCDLITLKGAPHRITEWTRFDATYKEQTAAWLTKTLSAR